VGMLERGCPGICCGRVALSAETGARLTTYGGIDARTLKLALREAVDDDLALCAEPGPRVGHAAEGQLQRASRPR
jgi:hypothetical protein